MGVWCWQLSGSLADGLFLLWLLKRGRKAGQEGRGDGSGDSMGVAPRGQRERAELPERRMVVHRLQQGLDCVCVGAEAVTHWIDRRLITLFKNKSLNNFIHETNRMM